MSQFVFQGDNSTVERLAVLGSNVKTSINVVIQEGAKVGENSIVYDNVLVPSKGKYFDQKDLFSFSS